jgi:hypothetical protein
MWVVDAHRDGNRFVVRADEKLTAFVELEAAIAVNCFDTLARSRIAKAFLFFNALETAAPVVFCTYENALSSRALFAPLVFNCDIRWKTIPRRRRTRC